MVTDDESVIRKDEPKKPYKPNPELEAELEAQGFRPFGYEW
jgi:hypothetical protein